MNNTVIFDTRRIFFPTGSGGGEGGPTSADKVSIEIKKDGHPVKTNVQSAVQSIVNEIDNGTSADKVTIDIQTEEGYITTNVQDAVQNIIDEIDSSSENVRIISELQGTVLSDDHLIIMDGNAAGAEQIITLPDMNTDSMTIIVRQLGDYGVSIIRGEKSFELGYDGDWVIFDWIKEKTNWYWRQ